MTCALPRCRDEMAINYMGHAVCDKHWLEHCAGKIDLKRKLNIRFDGQQTLR
jgi:hypothetical protein